MSYVVGEHFEGFIKKQVKAGRYNNASEVVREGLRLVEERETKLALLRTRLAEGETQLENGQGVNGEVFMSELIG